MGGLLGSFVKRRAYGVHNAFEISHYFVVPEAKDAIAACFQKTCSSFISPAFGFETMLLAIKFDNNPSPMTGEIRKIWSDRRLAAEMAAGDLDLFELSPELAFGRSSVAAKRSSARGSWISAAVHSPHP